MEYILYSAMNGISYITLSNDGKSNSLNLQMLDELTEAVIRAGKEKSRVIVIRANQGAKVWCAGLRIDQLPSPASDPVPYEYALEKTLKTIERFEGAVIGMIEGSVWGGGCELAFACDILVGTPAASFAITPARIGAPYNPNQVNRVLQRVGSNTAMEMFFTGDTIDAKRAYELGILNHVVNPGNIQSFTGTLSGKIVKNAPLVISLIKYQVHRLAEKSVEQVSNDPYNRKLIEKIYYGSDFEEGKKAFIEKREAVFNGE